MNKVIDFQAAAGFLRDDSTIMIGGFLNTGAPTGLINRLVEKQFKNLTVIANDTGRNHQCIGKLIENKQVRKLITSYIGANPETGRQMTSGELDVELVPQGTLIERIRCGGAGLGGFLTPTGIETVVENNKQKISVGQKDYLLELSLRGDIALIKASKADPYGNLVFHGTTSNFNPSMAMACDYVIVETDEIVELGMISPDEVMLPGIFVDAVVKSQEDAL